MNILYIASVRIPNEKASGLAIMRQCEAFARLGNGVVLLRPHRTNHVGDDAFEFYGIEKRFDIETMQSIDFYERLGIVGFGIARISQMIASLLFLIRHRKTIDLIYARDPYMLFLPILFFRNSKLCIWEAHQSQKGFCVQYVMKYAHRIVCISRGLGQHLKSIYSRDDIAVEPSGVHIEQFETNISKESVRHAFGIPKNAFVFAYIGKYTTMGDAKGVDELIRAFASVHKEFPATHLLIVGLEDVEMLRVRKIADLAGISQTAFTLLPLTQKRFAEYIAAADVLIMNYPNTEHYRHFMSPTKLFAYLASGKVTIASDLPSVRAIVGHNDVVHFVPPDDEVALAGVMCKVVGRSFDVTKSEAIDFVRKFSWTNRGERILAGMMSNRKKLM